MNYDFVDALQAINPKAQWTITGQKYETLNWLESSETKPTEEAINTKLAELNAAEPMKRLRFHRDKLLQECDWVVTKATETGVAETDAWKTYRQALRDLPSTQTPEMEAEPTTQLGIKNVTWPTKPS